MKNMANFFEQEDKKILLLTDKLHNVLTRLRYEGRASRSKNVKTAGEVFKNLGGTLKKHRHLYEKVIFPFLQVQIPRHEAAIHFLEAEHEDIKKDKDQLKKAIQKLSGDDRGLSSGKIYESGVYLISLLRHHIGFERRHIFKSIRRELRKDEKSVMARRIAGWLKKNKNGNPETLKEG